MVCREWTTAPQKLYLESMFPSYLAVDELPNHFWVALNEEFFQRFPETGRATLVVMKDVSPLQTLERLMRYGASSRGRAAVSTSSPKKKGSLFNFLRKTKATRPLRAIEVYHRMYKTKVTAELRRRGYDELTESAVARRVLEAGLPEVGVLTSEEVMAVVAAEAVATGDRVNMNCRLRMALQQTMVTEMLEGESEVIKNDVHKEMVALNPERAQALEEDDGEDERTPEQMQQQLTEVVGKVLSAISQETGLHACLLVGGPSPRREGEISTKTICLGTTPLGSDFQAFHPSFEKHVKTEFAKYLKQAFPLEVRKGRALVPDGAVEKVDALDGLIPVDTDSADNVVGPHNNVVVAPMPVAPVAPVLHQTTLDFPSIPLPLTPQAPAELVPGPPLTGASLPIPPEFDQTILDANWDYGGEGFLDDMELLGSSDSGNFDNRTLEGDADMCCTSVVGVQAINPK
ncbi:hypothetical protein B0H14DRAFT_3565188 [Mycena olivaceomarginata]|nr:hypothetical protein B0H14DRAFT_3565188 [Mycena olivaceomarginata]